MREKRRDKPPTVGGGFANQSPGDLCSCVLYHSGRRVLAAPTSSYTMDPRDCIHGRRFNAPCWAKHTKSLWSTPTRLTTNVFVHTHTLAPAIILYVTAHNNIVSFVFFFIINIIYYYCVHARGGPHLPPTIGTLLLLLL